MAVEPEEVEQDVHDRHVACEAANGGFVVDVHALLETLEARPARVVERDDLPVEHRVARAEDLTELAQLRIAARHVVAVARDESHAAAVDVREAADAVPLQLRCPALTRRRMLGERRVHGPEVVGRC